MIQKVEKGHTLLAKGPSRIILLKGKIEVFGKEFGLSKLETENTIIIPGAHKYPIYALEPVELDIFTNNKDNHHKTDYKMAGIRHMVERMVLVDQKVHYLRTPLVTLQ